MEEGAAHTGSARVSGREAADRSVGEHVREMARSRMIGFIGPILKREHEGTAQDTGSSRLGCCATASGSGLHYRGLEPGARS